MARYERGIVGGGGFDVCLECGIKVLRQIWTWSIESECPRCGSTMVREGRGARRGAVRRNPKPDVAAAMGGRGGVTRGHPCS